MIKLSARNSDEINSVLQNCEEPFQSMMVTTRNQQGVLYAKQSPTHDIFLSLLSVQDQMEFHNLREQFKKSEEKNRRNMGLVTFTDHLKKVCSFVKKNDCYDVYRGFVCGIEIGSSFMIVNTKRLKSLLSRSKSCVNGCLQKLGYSICRQGQDISGFFTTVLPKNSGSYCCFREWCIRVKDPKKEIIFPSFLLDEICQHYDLVPNTSSGKKNQSSIVKQAEKPIWDISCLLNHLKNDSLDGIAVRA